MAEELFPGRDNSIITGARLRRHEIAFKIDRFTFSEFSVPVNARAHASSLTTVLRSAVSTKRCQIIANTKKRMKQLSPSPMTVMDLSKFQYLENEYLEDSRALVHRVFLYCRR